MPYIQSFRIVGLAGRNDVVAHELNPRVNIFFGPNGSGKTSLLRILHSALLNDASLLKNVPFTSAQVAVYSYSTASSIVYTFSRQSEAEAQANGKAQRVRLASLLTKKDESPRWITDPPQDTMWLHKYLPTARLYEGPRRDPELSWLNSQRDETEQSLESRFAENLRNTWKDYSTQITSKVNQIQEDGLARILASVIARSESRPSSGRLNPHRAYESVTNFLSRRNVSDVSLSSDEFLRRYKKDQRLRSVATDIEAVEREISEVMAPREALRSLIGEMFIGEKSLLFSETGIEVDIDGKKIELALLSSGEKQLLKILVDTVIADTSIVLIDEPELSMHIDWQRRLVSSMLLLNPIGQLILATHSPEIMAETPDEQIFRI